MREHKRSDSVTDKVMSYFSDVLYKLTTVWLRYNALLFVETFLYELRRILLLDIRTFSLTEMQSVKYFEKLNLSLPLYA